MYRLVGEHGRQRARLGRAGHTIAVPAVFMYRLFTFSVPILPGWISFEWLKRNEYI